jgi:CRP-like cAMP-binding protein
MKAMLHVHTCFSTDGELTPRTIARLARERGFGAVLIADHFESLDVTGRVARQITLGEDYGEPAPDGIRITLPLAQSDIAEMVAATRERVNHLRVRLRKDGVLSVAGRRHITIHKTGELARLLSG